MPSRKTNSTHRCVAEEDECEILDSSCDISKGETMCPDGYCSAEGFSICGKSPHNETCGYEGRNVACINDPDLCAKTLKDCFNSLSLSKW